MRRMAIDEARFAQAGLAFALENGSGIFTIADAREVVRPAKVRVRIEGEELIFFPARSAGQASVLRMLGETF